MFSAQRRIAQPQSLGEATGRIIYGKERPGKVLGDAICALPALLRLCRNGLRSHALGRCGPMLRRGFYNFRDELFEPGPRIGNEFDFSFSSLRAFCHVRTVRGIEA